METLEAEISEKKEALEVVETISAEKDGLETVLLSQRFHFEWRVRVGLIHQLLDSRN